jgi:hypothetical protein
MGDVVGRGSKPPLWPHQVRQSWSGIYPTSTYRPAAVQEKGFELHAKHTESNHQVGTDTSADGCTPSRCMCRPMRPSTRSTGCPDEHTCKGPCWTGSWGWGVTVAQMPNHNSLTINAWFTRAHLMQRVSLGACARLCARDPDHGISKDFLCACQLISLRHTQKNLQSSMICQALNNCQAVHL